MFENEYVGNIHIHSIHSDGSSNVAEIAGMASKAGLDFICFHDHDYMLDRLNLEEEGFYGNLLVLIGLEIGRLSHHYLAFDIKEIVKGDSLGPQEVIDRVNQQGGFGILAHPFEKGMPFREKSRAYVWKDLSVRDYLGISIWEFSSRWKERVRTPFHGLFFLAFKKQCLKGPSRRTLSFWDQQCRERRVAAVGGSDAHGGLFKWGFLNFRPLPYEFLLNTINIHVLLYQRMSRDFGPAKKEVYRAIKEGRLFIAHDGLCPAKGFRFDFISDDGSNLFMGEEGAFNPGELVIELPEEGEIRLIKDGMPVQQWQGMEAVYRVKEKGVYRVEVYKRVFFFGWRPWIFSNPIYLR
ncbi:MAG: PHP domain-containing protein [Deltaproteobacteria bacterium]|nr:PHP domain-containing protein [Deltaproteobacteria bacterium]MBW2136756.1 PHP domain-containing protein [Deltaproteobacteria bacterium]